MPSIDKLKLKIFKSHGDYGIKMRNVFSDYNSIYQSFHVTIYAVVLVFT